MQFDWPGGARDTIGKFRPLQDVCIAQERYAFGLSRLANSDLNPCVIHETVLATGEIIAEEPRIFAHLAPTLDLSFSEVSGEQRIQLATVGTDDSRAVAKEFARPGSGEKPDLRTRQLVLVARGLIADQCGHLLAHDRVIAVFREEPVRVDAHQTEDHRWVLHVTILANEGWKTGHCNDVSIAACVNGHFSPDGRRPFFCISRHAFNFLAALNQGAHDRRVINDLDTDIREQRIGSLAPHQRIVNSREGLAVPYRRRKAAPMFHGSNEIVEKPVHHLSRRRGSIVSGGVHAADCARQTGDRAAAAEPIPLEQDHFRALPRCSHGGGNSGRPTANDEHVRLAREGMATIKSSGHGHSYTANNAASILGRGSAMRDGANSIWSSTSRRRLMPSAISTSARPAASTRNTARSVTSNAV